MARGHFDWCTNDGMATSIASQPMCFIYQRGDLVNNIGHNECTVCPLLFRGTSRSMNVPLKADAGPPLHRKPLHVTERAA